MVAKKVKELETHLIQDAIYGTGWDGGLVIILKRDGTIAVTPIAGTT